MIQRRQTLYLLTIVILGVLLYFCSVLQLATPASEPDQRMFELSANIGLQEVSDDMTYKTFEPLQTTNFWGLQVITLLIPLLALIDIFLYKKRILQARLNVFLAVVCLGYYAMLAMYGWNIIRSAHLHNHLLLDWHICFGSCIPLVSLVLAFGATRLILRDEAMVRAADRVR